MTTRTGKLTVDILAVVKSAKNINEHNPEIAWGYIRHTFPEMAKETWESILSGEFECQKDLNGDLCVDWNPNAPSIEEARLRLLHTMSK